MNYPLISVQDLLVPTAVVKVKVFEAPTRDELEDLINTWVESTQNLVVCPGPMSTVDRSSSVVITYVAAGENNDPDSKTKPPEMADTSSRTSSKGSRSTAKESDGGRIA